MNEKNKYVDPSCIHLLNIRILKAQFEIMEEQYESDLHLSDFKIGLKSETAFNYEEKRMRFRLYIKIVGQDDNDEPVGANGEYLLEYSYVIDNLDDFAEENEGRKVVSPTLGATVAGISYSTARGIVLGRTQATDFDGVLLPVIDPYSLLGEDSFSDM